MGVIIAAALAAAGCGKKGPPLAPLNLVPDRPQEIAGRMVGETTVLQFTVPTRNAGGQGPLALDHLEIYAVTVAAGAVTPPNRELLTPSHVIGRIPVKPPPDPEASEEEAAEVDTRAAPGEKITFTEKLTAAQRVPEVLAQPAKTAPSTSPAASGQPPASTPEPAAPPVSPPGAPVPAGGSASSGISPGAPGAETAPAAQPPGAPAAVSQPAPEKPADYPTRIYALRGMTRKGKAGPASPRVIIPLVTAPPPPAGVAGTFSETAVTLTWKAADVTGTPRPVRYNVYSVPSSGSATAPAVASGSTSGPLPLNPQPVETLAFEHAGAAPGAEQCFVVRTVETIASIALESAPSDAACVTPRDIFPPSAPKNLAAVSGTGAINLIWDPNPEADVAGYLVLRAEAPGDTLQPITPSPVRDARYTDTAVTPGVRYVYAVVAVDRTEPPNRSAPSNRVEETAR